MVVALKESQAAVSDRQTRQYSSDSSHSSGTASSNVSEELLGSFDNLADVDDEDHQYRYLITNRPIP